MHRWYSRMTQIDRGRFVVCLALIVVSVGVCLYFLCFVIGLASGISKIVMGAVHLNDCPLENMIPVWLIVSGVATIMMCGYLWKMVFGIIGLLFNNAWLICGSIFIYPNYGKIHAGDFIPCTENITTGCTKHCHQPLLDFSVAMLTIDWIIFVLGCVLIGCTKRDLATFTTLSELKKYVVGD